MELDFNTADGRDFLTSGTTYHLRIQGKVPNLLLRFYALVPALLRRNTGQGSRMTLGFGIAVVVVIKFGGNILSQTVQRNLGCATLQTQPAVCRNRFPTDPLSCSAVA